MPHTFYEKIRRWILETSVSEDIQNIHELIEYFAKSRYGDYVPTKGAYPDFLIRLRNWLDCLHSEEDQKILFKLIPYIFFITENEFLSLYRTAFKGIIIPWIIDELDLKFDNSNFDILLNNAIRETWFCPLTDSMEIAKFCHANRIEGQDLRPDFRSLMSLGDKEEIIKYIIKSNIKRIVLLEDFVGSGSQVRNTVIYAANLRSRLPVLFSSLIVCPEGLLMGESLESGHSNIKFEPVIALPIKAFLRPVAIADEPELFLQIRNLIHRIESTVKGIKVGAPYYGPFGYRDTGAIVVPFSNCPDNSLPLLHYESETWRPLFPRASRL